MTIKELDDKLNSPGFQDPKSGDLFYNFFIYQYPIEQEYEIRKQIMDFKANLIRPVNYVDVWKSPVRVTPEAQVPLTLESKFRMTPIKS